MYSLCESSYNNTCAIQFPPSASSESLGKTSVKNIIDRKDKAISFDEL